MKRKNEVFLPSDIPNRIFFGITFMMLIYVIYDNFQHYNTMPSFEFTSLCILSFIGSGFSRSLFVDEHETFMSINCFGIQIFQKRVSQHCIESYDVIHNTFSNGKQVSIIDSEGKPVATTKWLAKHTALLFHSDLAAAGIKNNVSDAFEKG